MQIHLERQSDKNCNSNSVPETKHPNRTHGRLRHFQVRARNIRPKIGAQPRLQITVSAPAHSRHQHAPKQQAAISRLLPLANPGMGAPIMHAAAPAREGLLAAQNRHRLPSRGKWELTHCLCSCIPRLSQVRLSSPTCGPAAS